MDERFLDLARAATAGSSQVRPVYDRSEQTRVRRPASFSRDQADVTDWGSAVRLQLVDDDGWLDWEDVTGSPPGLDRFRGPLSTSAASDVEGIELEFKRLPPSKVTEFLSRRDERLTPHRGLRRLNCETRQLEPAEPPSDGEALVFIHGTFSNSENMLAGLLDEANSAGHDFLRQASRRYRGNLFTFDHPTLSVGPILNAIDFQRVWSGSDAELHLVSHSRGGLVTRWWCEMFDSECRRCDKAIFVGTPLAGTALAAPPNIRQTIGMLTQLSRALQTAAGLTAIAVPIFSVVEALLRVVTSITSLGAKTPVADAAMAMVPGLFAMSRVGNNPELARLLESPPTNPARYFAVQSDFQPTDPAWKFWRMFRKQRVIDAAADVLFDGPNDLVVDTASMNDLAFELEIPADRTHDFGLSERVHHLNYFYQAETAGFLAETLL